MKKIYSLLLASIFCVSLIAQNNIYTDTLSINFRQGSSKIEHDFMNNSQHFKAFKELLNYRRTCPELKLIELRVEASASPDGDYAINTKLPNKRATAILSYLKNDLKLNIPKDIYSQRVYGPNWEGLREVIANSSYPFKQKALNILDTKKKVEWHGEASYEPIKSALMKLDAGVPWGYLSDKIFPNLRYARAYAIYKGPERTKETVAEFNKKLEAKKEVSQEVKQDTAIVSVLVDEPVSKEINVDTVAKKPYYVGLRTNLLSDLCLIPDLGAEIYLGSNISTVLNWSYSWWYSDVTHYYWQTYGGDLELRYWFGKAANNKPLTGFHAGVYGQMRTYDIEFGHKGYQGAKWHFGGGLSFGYSLPVAKRVNIDFSLGLGYFGGTYKEYVPYKKYYLWRATKSLKYFGPTKAEITLVWLIGRGNYNRK